MCLLAPLLVSIYNSARTGATVFILETKVAFTQNFKIISPVNST